MKASISDELKKWGYLTALAIFLLIIVFSLFYEIIAYYLAFFAGVIYSSVIRTILIKHKHFPDSSFKKLYLLFAMVTPFYVSYYFYFEPVLGVFSKLLGNIISTFLFLFVLQLSVRSLKSRKIQINGLICSVISIAPAYLGYLDNEFSGLFPILAVLSMFIWQLYMTSILSKAFR